MTADDSDETRSNWLRISKRQQWAGFLIGLWHAAVIAFAAYLLYDLSRVESTSSATAKPVLLWACLGGLIGGAGRSIYKMSLHWGGHGKDRPSDYFDKWFVYLLKPFVGVVGGVSFVLAVNVGLVRIFTTSQTELDLSRVLLTSVIGALFFEDVFVLLRKAIGFSKEEE